MHWANLKVLIIDDDATMRTLLRNLLRQLSIREVVEAPDGREGLVATARLRPRMVFCDLHMLPVGGLTYLAKLRRSSVPELASTPVIMITADSSEKAVAGAAQHAPNGYLVKPISLDAVRRAIERVMAMDGDGV